MSFAIVPDELSTQISDECPQIVLKMIKTHHDEDGWERFKFKLNDEKLGTKGRFGGYPEDNSRGRDYAWVEELLEELGKELGYRFVCEG